MASVPSVPRIFLFDHVTLVPEEGKPGTVLRGGLTAMPTFAGSKKPGAVFGAWPQALAIQASLVAGARNHLNLLFDAQGLAG